MRAESSRLEEAVCLALAAAPARELVCFSVFDTLLLRMIGEPSSLFTLLGERLHGDGFIVESAETFARARLAAERRVRTQPRAPTLESIYGEMAHAWPAIAPRLEEFARAELELESELLCPAPGADTMVACARRRGARIAFLYDGYLPRDFVRRELMERELAICEDRIYASKAPLRGLGLEALYRRVLLDHPGPARRVLHVGPVAARAQRLTQTVDVPRISLPETGLNRYERALEQASDDSGGLTGLFAGASRLSRLQHVGSGDPHALTTVTAGVAAPLLVGFTLWLIERARQAGIPRLYFLAREGEVLFELARILDFRMNLGLDIRYLHVSRQALNHVLLTEPSRANIQWALTHTRAQRLRGTLERLGLRPEDVASELEAAGFSRSGWDAYMPAPEHSRLIEFLSSGPVRSKLVLQATGKRSLVERYLTEQGFFDDEAMGLVDTTGTGSQYRTLAMLRREHCIAPTEGFLILRDWVEDLDETDFPRIHAYFSDRRNMQGIIDAPGVIQMLEAFCTTRDGTVLGYEQREGSVEPLLDTPAAGRHPVWSAESLRRSVYTFASVLPLRPLRLCAGRDPRGGIAAAFADFWNRPTREEARFWGAYQFEVGSGRDKYYAELAPELTLGGVIDLIRGGPRRTEWYTWTAAVSARSELRARIVILTLQRMRRALGRGRTQARQLVGKLKPVLLRNQA